MKYNYNTGQTTWERIRHSKLLAVGLIVLLVLVVTATAKEKKSQQKTKDNINTLEQEIAELKGQNSNLSSLIEYLRSDGFVDREAREKLNMQKPGEKVVLVSEARKNSGQVAGAVTIEEKSNWQLWKEYFFGKR